MGGRRDHGTTLPLLLLVLLVGCHVDVSYGSEGAPDHSVSGGRFRRLQNRMHGVGGGKLRTQRGQGGQGKTFPQLLVLLLLLVFHVREASSTPINSNQDNVRFRRLQNCKRDGSGIGGGKRHTRGGQRKTFPQLLLLLLLLVGIVHEASSSHVAAAGDHNIRRLLDRIGIGGDYIYNVAEERFFKDRSLLRTKHGNWTQQKAHCANKDYTMGVFVDDHVQLIAKPLAEAAGSNNNGCLPFLFHDDASQTDPTRRKEILTIATDADLVYKDSLFFEGRTFPFADIAEAFEVAQVGVQEYDMVRNNCAIFVLDMLSYLGIPVQDNEELISYVTQRLTQNGGSTIKALRESPFFDEIRPKHSMIKLDLEDDATVLEILVRHYVGEYHDLQKYDYLKQRKKTAAAGKNKDINFPPLQQWLRNPTRSSSNHHRRTQGALSNDGDAFNAPVENSEDTRQGPGEAELVCKLGAPPRGMDFIFDTYFNVSSPGSIEFEIGCQGAPETYYTGFFAHTNGVIATGDNNSTPPGLTFNDTGMQHITQGIGCPSDEPLEIKISAGSHVSTIFIAELFCYGSLTTVTATAPFPGNVYTSDWNLINGDEEYLWEFDEDNSVGASLLVRCQDLICPNTMPEQYRESNETIQAQIDAYIEQFEGYFK